MPEDEQSQYHAIWTTDLHEYALLETKFAGAKLRQIYHVPTRTFLLMEDSEEFNYVIKHMIEAGVKIVSVQGRGSLYLFRLRYGIARMIRRVLGV